MRDLAARGHVVMGKNEDWSEGRISGARIEPDGQMFAGANPRGTASSYAVEPLMRTLVQPGPVSTERIESTSAQVGARGWRSRSPQG